MRWGWPRRIVSPSGCRVDGLVLEDEMGVAPENRFPIGVAGLAA